MPPSDHHSVVWSVTNESLTSSGGLIASVKWPLGITKWPDGAAATGSVIAPGLHSILAARSGNNHLFFFHVEE